MRVRVRPEQLISYIRILLVFIIGLYISMKTEIATISGLPLQVFLFLALAYSISINLLIKKVRTDYISLLCWIFDIFLITVLILITGSITSPFIGLLFLLLLLFSIRYPLRYGLIGATIVTAVYLLIFYQSPADERSSIDVLKIVFNICIFYILIFTRFLSPETEEEVETIIEETQNDGKFRSCSPGSGDWGTPRTLEDYDNAIKRLIMEKEEENRKFRDERQKNNTIRTIAHNISTQKDLSTLYRIIVESTKLELKAQAAFIFMYEDGILKEGYYDDAITEITVRAIRESEILNESIHTCKTIRYGSKQADILNRTLVNAREQIKSLLLVPLKTIHDSSPFGIIGMMNHQTIRDGQSSDEDEKSLFDFSREDEDFLGLIAVDAAIAIRNIEFLKDLERMYKALEKSYDDLEISYDETIRALAQTIEIRDKYTHGHVDRVTEFAVQLATALRLPEEEIRNIRKGATLHDVGKIGTPDHILSKKGPLDKEERRIMEEHAMNSVCVLKGIASLEKDILDLVLYHHEKYDGTGYPCNLKGELIPIGARIIAVADTFDAMTSDRPYRKGFSRDVALRKMKEEGRGTQFDPDILDIFVKIMSEKI